MTGPIPGAPVAPIRGQKSRFMFLGGALDHATRELPTTGALHVPPETIRTADKIVGRYSPSGARVIEGETYVRHRVTGAGDRSWFTLVLAGHNPSTSDLLDTYPYPPIV